MLHDINTKERDDNINAGRLRRRKEKMMFLSAAAEETTECPWWYIIRIRCTLIGATVLYSRPLCHFMIYWVVKVWEQPLFLLLLHSNGKPITLSFFGDIGQYLLVFHWDVHLHLETTTKHKVDKKNFECFQNLAPMSLLDSAHQNNSLACDKTV